MDKNADAAKLLGPKPRQPFHKGHYNIIAKQIKVNLEKQITGDEAPDSRLLDIAARGALVDLAFDLTKRFQQDNPRFSPTRFLEACSPDNVFYPLAELWDADGN